MKYLLLLIFFPFVSYTQTNDSLKTADELNFNDDLGLEELMNVKLTVASQKELTIEQTPAIVSVLTKDDIQRSASKDLTDVLRLIPGFEFTGDVNSEIGIGVRGLTATEGKVLVMIDGLQMNENLYGTTSWIGRFDINQIEKIEIIRGPGYAAYNGFASLGVINIITKKAKDIQGIEAHTTYSRLGNSLGRKQLSVTAGWQKNNWGIKGSLYTGELYRSEGIFTDLDSSQVVMNKDKNNYVKPFQAYLVGNYKNLEIKYLHENYNTTTPFHLDLPLLKTGMSSFQTRQIDASYKWVVSTKLTLIPRVNFTNNRPYLSNQYNDSNNIDPGYFVFDHDNYRFTSGITGQYKLREHIQLNAGLGYFHDKAEKHLASYSPINSGDSVLAQYQDINDYLEIFFQKPSYTASLGMRHEYHSVFGNVYLPRLAFTKQFDKMNIKVAYSHAFRAPLGENLLANPTLKPEITKVAEIQLGYRLTKNLNVSINVFDNQISNVIVYDVINAEDNYFNFSKLGTRGVESELLYRLNSLTFGCNYSYYIKTTNDVVKYAGDDKNNLLGFSPHKFTGSIKHTITNNLDVSSSFIFVGKRCAYTHDNSNDEPVQSEIKQTLIWNATINYKNIGNKGISAQFGIFDITNSGYVYVQAYNGDKAPFRATGRELSLKLSYVFSTK